MSTLFGAAGPPLSALLPKHGGDGVPDVLESITDGFHQLDSQACFVRFNATAREIYQAQGLDAQELLGKNMFEVFPDAEDSDIGRAMRSALAGNATILETEYAPWQRWFSIRNYPMPAGGVATFFLDITARKRAEYALHDGQKLYRALVEVSPQTVWYGGTDGAISFVNQHWVNYTGMSVEHSLGDGWSAAIAPAERERVLHAWRLAARQTRWEMEIPLRRHDGEYRWHLARGIPMHGDHGQVDGWIGVAMDIHERKEAELAVRGSEDKYRTLFDSMDEGYCVIDVLFDEQGRPNDWRFLEINPAFSLQNGLPQSSVGKRIKELVPDIEPKWFDTYGRVALTGEPNRFTEDSGALGRWFDLYAFRIGGPESRKVAVLFTNITDRVLAERAQRKSEERLRALTNASSSVIYRMNADWTEALEVEGRGFLLDVAEPMRDWADRFVPHEDQPPIRAAIRTAIESKTVYQMEHRVERVDGTLGWASSRAVPLLDDGGEIVEWFGMVTDISERKLAEEALRKNEKLAVVGRLAATISHEINNPLESVTNLLYLIAGGSDLATAHRYAATAQEELARVSHIVTHTLRLSRQSTTATEERLSTLIDSALAIYEGRIRVSELHLVRDYAANDAIVCYASELRQVFSNLIANAFDATRTGGTLTLRTGRRRHARSGEPGVSVLIADTGQGMSAATLRRLSEPFFTTKGSSGTGLGIWVSKSILDKHNASFRVKSSEQPGRSGTVWSMWFPVAAAG